MKRLRFLHIPKTAGTTFTSILLRQYGEKNSFYLTGDPDQDIKRFKALSYFGRRRVVLFTGHAAIDSGVKESDEANIVTFLRDPAERVKSFCKHVSEGKSPYLLEQFPPESFDLDRFLQSGNAELSNLQTKMLLNSGQATSSLRLNKMSATEARNEALDVLNNRIFRFGIQEYFDESLVVMSSALNWKLPVYEALNKKSAIDIEVYKVANEQFLSKVSSESFDQKMLDRLRQNNNLEARA